MNERSPSAPGQSTSLDFYRYLGVHSLLIGLFPFFIPVYLWMSGYSLASICLFIAVSGAAFCGCLRLWEYSALKLNLSALFSVTFLLELLLLAAVFLFPDANSATTDEHSHTRISSPLFLLTAFGLCNGFYNCFFWTTQRSIFVNLVTRQNSGRRYGNFQIFVMIFLKGGILLGGLMLQHLGFIWVFTFSFAVALSAIYYCMTTDTLKHRLPAHPPVTLTRIIKFTDNYASRTIFIIDGIFLFLESHFWTLSLFFLTNQNYAQLGGMVIILAVLFSVFFLLTKNTIDGIQSQRVYQYAVLAYALTWWLRTLVDKDQHNQVVLALLLLITFLSSFFRLTFNKKFYDIANESDAREYLVIKSYYTQISTAFIFVGLACTLYIISAYTAAASAPMSTQSELQFLYGIAGVVALVYLLYRQK